MIKTPTQILPLLAHFLYKPCYYFQRDFPENSTRENYHLLYNPSSLDDWGVGTATLGWLQYLISYKTTNQF